MVLHRVTLEPAPENINGLGWGLLNTRRMSDSLPR